MLWRTCENKWVRFLVRRTRRSYVGTKITKTDRSALVQCAHRRQSQLLMNECRARFVGGAINTVKVFLYEISRVVSWVFIYIYAKLLLFLMLLRGG